MGLQRAAPRSHRYTRRRLFGVGAGLAAAALLGGCEENEPGPASTPASPGEAPAIVEETPAPGRGGGVLRLGLAGDIEIPPAFVYSPLVAVDPREGRVYGDLAQAVERAGPLTVSFELRPDTRFHPSEDGVADALGASDVVRSFEEQGAAGAFLFSEVIERVEAPDERTVVLQLAAPFSLLFEFLGDAAVAGVRSTERYERTTMPRGSGPFAPAPAPAAGETASDEDFEVLGAHPLYHHPGLPLLDGIELQRVDSSSALAAAFAAGEVAVGRVASSEPAELPEATTQRRSAREMFGLGLSLLGMKGRGPVRFNEAFQDPRVRRAISVALGRDALSTQLGGVVSGPVGPAHPADALPLEELEETSLYHRDPDEAHKLLEAAEHVDLELRIEAPSSAPLRQAAQLLETQLREAGFTVRLQLLPPEEWERNLLAGDFEATLLELGGLDTPDLGLRLHTSGGADGTSSLWGYSNPAYDVAVRAALAALDPLERAERSREAQRLLLEDVPGMLPIAAPDEHLLISDRLRGYAFDAYEFNQRWLPARWSLAPA